MGTTHKKTLHGFKSRQVNQSGVSVAKWSSQSHPPRGKLLSSHVTLDQPPGPSMKPCLTQALSWLSWQGHQLQMPSGTKPSQLQATSELYGTQAEINDYSKMSFYHVSHHTKHSQTDFKTNKQTCSR